MRTFLVLSALIAIALIAAAITIEFMTADGGAPQLTNARTLIWNVGSSAWSFAQPLFQLIIVLLILEWIFSRVGIRLRINEVATDWTIQTFIAGTIIVTFCIAALADTKAVGYLKDVVLIVIGFYFGSAARSGLRGRVPSPETASQPLAAAVTIDATVPATAPKGQGETKEESADRARRGFDGTDESSDRR